MARALIYIGLGGFFGAILALGILTPNMVLPAGLGGGTVGLLISLIVTNWTGGRKFITQDEARIVVWDLEQDLYGLPLPVISWILGRVRDLLRSFY